MIWKRAVSPEEISKHETKKLFLIPSFITAAKQQPSREKSALIHIDITPEWSKLCMEIQPEQKDSLQKEKFNDQHIVKLKLMNPGRYFDDRHNCIRGNHGQ